MFAYNILTFDYFAQIAMGRGIGPMGPNRFPGNGEAYGAGGMTPYAQQVSVFIKHFWSSFKNFDFFLLILKFDSFNS